MKKYFFLVILLTTTACAFGQQSGSSPVLTKRDYLQKSRSQKNIAWAMVGSGLGLIAFGPVINLSGGILDGSNPNKGIWVSYLGGATTLASIPFFIAASKNKKKAAGLSFKNETFPQLQKDGVVYKMFPSLTLKISL